ncbi:hypothetical protein [Aneurinibacillus danicus]|uniref:Uncharacterized protein n=1 Tax=Aneurinibacillus danicus TaxID=267746 RepID=A0A511VAJ0_9BACL|nr:hypothetical protein [Aneurinibacillus danicus]GEN35940.1 hypothetical protein ADA01nite_34000 [Aneurinibacillus danicus]
MEKKITRISLLADEDIKKWWEDYADHNHRQEKLREAVKIGIEVLEGKKGIVSTEKQELYDAIETLLRQGIIPQSMPKKKADIALLRQNRQSILNSIR